MEMELLFSLGRERLLQEENKNKYSIEVESSLLAGMRTKERGKMGIGDESYD